MPRTIALIPIDLTRSRLGTPSALLHRLGERTVLERTLSRLAQVPQVEMIVLVHPANQQPLLSLNVSHIAKPVRAFAIPPSLPVDGFQPMRIAARQWALHSWRGGLGSACVYDELLPAAPLVAAMQDCGATSALLAGGDWPLIDPAICGQVLERHLAQPQAMKMVFTQAPPGLAGVAVAREMLEHVAEKQTGFGPVLAYVPTKPQADPIGLDVCVPIPAPVRSCAMRFIYDTQRSRALIDAIASDVADEGADASQIVAAAIGQEKNAADSHTAAPVDLPAQITLELTPQRMVRGCITPQHYVDFERAPMEIDAARRLIAQIAECDDTVLTLGGLGDALLHPNWRDVVIAAHEAGVAGIAVETDLLVDEATLSDLLALPVDVVSVRVNADTAAVYEKVMGEGRFAEVVKNVQWLLIERGKRCAQAAQVADGRAGLPWIVPRLVKTSDTLGDMETFFDRWTHFAGHAVIEPSQTGRHGATQVMPQLSPVRMAPPRRFACRQLERRLTILSDGRAALCDQDWLGSHVLGDTAITPLCDIWQRVRSIRAMHHAGRWNELPQCAGCHEWHRP